MMLEICLVFPLYLTIFVIFYRFRRIIKAMAEIDEILCAENDNTSEEVSENNKRDFFFRNLAIRCFNQTDIEHT